MSDQPDHWFDHGVWSNPLFLGAVTMIAFAISFTPRASEYASWFCLSIAWLLITRLIYTRVKIHRGKITLVSSCFLLLIFAAFGFWLVAPIKTTIAEAISLSPSLPKPSPLAEVVPQPTTTPTADYGGRQPRSPVYRDSNPVTDQPTVLSTPSSRPPAFSPSPTPKPDWRDSDEAKELAAHMIRDVQNLIDEGRLIDLTDYQQAVKAYVAWSEKCSVTLGRIDNQMRKFNRETSYREGFVSSLAGGHRIRSDEAEGRRDLRQILTGQSYA